MKKEKPTKKKKLTEKELSDAMPKGSILMPIHLRDSHMQFEQLYICIGTKSPNSKPSVLYVTDCYGELIEQESYKARNPNHLTFNQNTISSIYNLYS